MASLNTVRTWIEISRKALHHNVEQFLKLIPERTRLMAVVKSNAYGHGLVPVAKILSNLQAPNSKPRNTTSIAAEGGNHEMVEVDTRGKLRLWFGVDSIVEALRLRREGIENPILVLGHTLPSRTEEAAACDTILTVSTTEALEVLGHLKTRPTFHLKIDTGMHRQGFLPHDIFKLVKLLKRFKLTPAGVYTHFASAKDPADRDYTLRQLTLFEDVISALERAGIRGMIRHAAATGGTLLFPESHLDMVRIGMGLYGYWPSAESKASLSIRMFKTFKKHAPYRTEGSGAGFKSLKPALTWKTIVGEVKEIPKGSLVGYDGTECTQRRTKIAVLPIGYWHGYDRGLSGIGEILIRGKRARVLGRVSMDMVVADVTDVPRVKIGDEAVLIGRQGGGALWADELAAKIGTTPYEFLTRINPLIRRIPV